MADEKEKKEITEEEVLGKAYDAHLMKRLLHYLKPYRGWVLLAIVLTIGVSLATTVRPYLTKVAIDNYIVHKDYTGLRNIILLLFGTLLFQGILQYSMTYLTQWIGQKTIYDLRMELFAHLQNLSMRFFDKNPVGRLVTRLTNDIEVLNEMFSSGIVMVFADVFTIAGISDVHVLIKLAAYAYISFGHYTFNLCYNYFQEEGKDSLQGCKNSCCKNEFIPAGACERNTGCKDFQQREKDAG